MTGFETGVETSLEATKETGKQGITDNDSWMPRSGYGPYCTIPLSSGTDPALFAACGISSFAATRREIRLLAADYAARAVELFVRARQERADLSREIRGINNEILIRPHRVRLCLLLDEERGYLSLDWRGVVKRYKGFTRTRCQLRSCQAELSPLIADVHPAEELLIQRLEAEAADIRRRWFGLVRMVHYMNVTEDFRSVDLKLGRIYAVGFTAKVMRQLRDTFKLYGRKS